MHVTQWKFGFVLRELKAKLVYGIQYERKTTARKNAKLCSPFFHVAQKFCRVFARSSTCEGSGEHVIAAPHVHFRSRGSTGTWGD